MSALLFPRPTTMTCSWASSASPRTSEECKTLPVNPRIRPNTPYTYRPPYIHIFLSYICTHPLSLSLSHTHTHTHTNICIYRWWGGGACRVLDVGGTVPRGCMAVHAAPRPRPDACRQQPCVSSPPPTTAPPPSPHSRVFRTSPPTPERDNPPPGGASVGQIGRGSPTAPPARTATHTAGGRRQTGRPSACPRYSSYPHSPPPYSRRLIQLLPVY